MAKLDLLKELGRLATENSLDADQIRLYLLLLANCRESRTGQIEYTTIRSAIGREFTPEKLKKACQQLSIGKMIAVTSLIPDSTDNEDFLLSYTVLETTH